MEWMPIETAPKECGIFYLVWIPSKVKVKVEKVYFNEGENEWFDLDGKSYRDASYWMPLPVAPN